MHDILRWLPGEQQISYRIASMIWCCLLGLTLVCLHELCGPLFSATSSRSLRSSQQGLLLVLIAHTSTKESRVLFVEGPSTWNGLPSKLCIFPSALSPVFFLTLRLLCLVMLELWAP